MAGDPATEAIHLVRASVQIAVSTPEECDRSLQAISGARIRLLPASSAALQAAILKELDLREEEVWASRELLLGRKGGVH
jgi:2-phospho-L-lactate transferase/gluconeogenesis factor (CofD/UPF0052 family)